MDIYSIIDKYSRFSVLLRRLFLFRALTILSQSLCCWDADARRLSPKFFVFLYDEKLCRSTAATLYLSLTPVG
jgi:hypothetical protein